MIPVAIEELLRYISPVQFSPRRVAMEDVAIGDVVIRKGEGVFALNPAANRDPEVFPDPDTFDPTRFIGDAVKDRPRSAYLPFGGGRRICIGRSFALVEMVLMAAMISQRFPFDVCPDHGVELETTLTLRPKHGLRVVAHRREVL